LGILLLFETRFAGSGIVLALAAMTRPEGALIAAVAALHLWVAEKKLIPPACVLRFVAAFALLFLPYWGWRWWYYGWPLPNTFYVKAGRAASEAYKAAMRAHGAYYIHQWATQTKIFYAVPLAILGVVKQPRFGTFAVVATTLYLAYAFSVGGDFMGLH